jgi:hypothetical protein
MTPEEKKVNEIVRIIVGGEVDSGLREISEAYRLRREAIAAALLRELKVGARVLIRLDVRPKYLAGCKATVKGIVRGRVVVDLDDRTNRFHLGVRCYPTQLELLPEPPKPMAGRPARRIRHMDRN